MDVKVQELSGIRSKSKKLQVFLMDEDEVEGENSISYSKSVFCKLLVSMCRSGFLVE
jgi:hypothetical protein